MTPDDLIDYDVRMPFVSDDRLHRRTIGVRLAGPDPDTANRIAANIQFAIAGHGWKIPAKNRLSVQPTSGSLHPREHDQWSRQLQPGLSVAVDRTGCIVLHGPVSTTTISNVTELIDTLLNARDARDIRESRR